MACSQTVGVNLCQRHSVRENLSTDSIVSRQAESVCLWEEKTCVHAHSQFYRIPRAATPRGIIRDLMKAFPLLQKLRYVYKICSQLYGRATSMSSKLVLHSPGLPPLLTQRAINNLCSQQFSINQLSPQLLARTFPASVVAPDPSV